MDNIAFRKLLQQIEREDTKMLVLRVMVGLVILYDHVHPEEPSCVAPMWM